MIYRSPRKVIDYHHSPIWFFKIFSLTSVLEQVLMNIRDKRRMHLVFVLEYSLHSFYEFQNVSILEKKIYNLHHKPKMGKYHVLL